MLRDTTPLLRITNQNKITLLTNCPWKYAECNPLISSFTVQNIFTGVLTVILRDTKRPLNITNQNKIAFLETNLFLILSLHFASGLGRRRLFPDPAPDLVHSGLQRGAVRHASRCHHRALLQNLHLSESNSYLKGLCVMQFFPFQGSQSAKYQLQGAAEKDK